MLGLAAPFAVCWISMLMANDEYSNAGTRRLVDDGVGESVKREGSPFVTGRSAQTRLSGEQFGIGGASSVRGTTERPVSGDRGVFGSLEFNSPELMPGLRWAGFVDAGHVSSETSAASPKLASDRLGSFGLGLRYSAGMISASAEWARLIAGSKVPLALNSESPQKGDHKVHLNLSVRF